MKIKLDENMPVTLAEVLTAAGHDVDTVPQEQLAGYPDPEVWFATQEAGRFLIKDLNVELGIWEGTYRKLTSPWLRVWDPNTGKMLPLAEERAESAEMGLEETLSIVVEQATELEARGKRIETAEKLAESRLG